LDWQRDFLVYRFDDLLPVGDEESIAFIDIPLNAQFTVTSIRTHRNTPQQRQFWEPVLRRVEAKIAEMLSIISEGEVEGEEIRRLLQGKSFDIAEIYGQELDRMAKANDKEGAVTEMRTVVRYVNLTTSPAGGLIRYMPAGRWSLYLFMTQQRNRRDYPEPEWTTLRQTEAVPLAGKNWFSITWPNGANHKELIHITSDRPITFTPAGR
jgi:hypothetical protein